MHEGRLITLISSTRKRIWSWFQLHLKAYFNSFKMIGHTRNLTKKWGSYGHFTIGCAGSERSLQPLEWPLQIPPDDMQKSRDFGAASPPFGAASPGLERPPLLWSGRSTRVLLQLSLRWERSLQIWSGLSSRAAQSILKLGPSFLCIYWGV